VRHAVPRLWGGGVLVYAALALTGLALTRTPAGGIVVATDRRVSEWFFEHRTTTLTAWTHVGSSLSDTMTAIAVTIVLVIALRWWLRRWIEALALLASILGELFVFVLVTATVHRQRPDVPRLDPAPPTSSFPSGHTGAAVALYVGLAVIVWRVTARAVRAATAGALVVRAWTLRAGALVLCLVPAVVGVSRLYRGMHFLTDVVAGALAGGLWMVIVMVTLLGPTSYHAASPHLRRDHA
jgi:undecaprenyl-diphosphatase